MKLLDHYMNKSDALSSTLKKVQADLGNSQAEVRPLDELYDQSKTLTEALEEAKLDHNVDLMRAKFYCAVRELFKNQSIGAVLVRNFCFLALKPVDKTAKAMNEVGIDGLSEFANAVYYPIFAEFHKTFKNATNFTNADKPEFKGLYTHGTRYASDDHHPLDTPEYRKELWFDAWIGPFANRQMKDAVNLPSVWLKKYISEYPRPVCASFVSIYSIGLIFSLFLLRQSH